MCRTSCYTEQSLTEHRKIHSDDYFFKCDICHIKYKRKETLQRHQIRAHSDIAVQFVCDSCGQSFKLKVDLLNHIKRKHSTSIYICRYCGKSVTDLRNHEWKHKERAETGSLKFSCQFCANKFKNQTRLDNHLLLHKQGYKCTECNLVVISYRQLKYHKERMHKPDKLCPICKKSFMSRGNQFAQHILTHAGIRPYNCDICGEDFTQRSSLFRHRKNHPGPVPPYKSKIPIAGLAKNFLQKFLEQ
nr:PREDICTED: zinc finger protein 502-like [Linepithema humile]